MKEYLQTLFAYDDWANREVVTALEALEVPPPRSMKYLAHIVSAERLWLERLRVEKQTYPVWPDFTLEHCKLEIAQLREQWKSYLASLKEDGLSRSLTYRNSKGESWTNAKQDILMHVIMHSAYHRGQIASDMRAAGFTPVLTDFIHGVRQGLVE
ncbi:MAG TPA: DinB family protein [Terriglobales bacterium]|nr:DinB family protein [Terriglobales bacterium]